MKLPFLMLLLAAASFLPSCASTPKDEQVQGNEPVSDLPWNRPQRWEGQGMMGGMSQ